MEKAKFGAFCQRLADEFLSAEPLALARYYSYPLAIYWGDSVRIEANPSETAAAVSERRRLVRAAGAERISASVLSESISTDGRVQIKLTWKYETGSGKALEASFLTYFGTETADGVLRIGIIQFESLAFMRPTGKIHGPN